MSGDQIAGVIGLSVMLLVLIQRLMSREIASKTLIRMASIWAIIIVVAVIAVWIIQKYIS